MPQVRSHPCWDIFCTVIDNYGDIGVCWRLARQLAAEHRVAVRLWVDDLTVLHRLCPEIDAHEEAQHWRGIEIRRWPAELPPVEAGDIPDVVVEAFACRLPDAYERAMAEHRPPPRWINLEYLSAENWVAGCHRLASPHPRLPLTKHFFFPGFDARSGGLLREAGLIDAQASFAADAWWRTAGGRPPAEALCVSLFAYENDALPELVRAWSQGEQPLVCLVPESRVLASLAAAVGGPLRVGDCRRVGALEIRVLPFVRQEAYDALLNACDVNFVRGEDSLVRAIWAGKPFVWHIYPQDDAAHWAKLAAFLDRHTAALPAAGAAAVRQLMVAWNRQSFAAADWQHFRDQLPALAGPTRTWRESLAGQQDLAAALVNFCNSGL